MNWTRVCRTLGLVGILLFAISAFSPVPNLLVGQERATARLDRAEAIVVLGGEGVRSEATLGSDSLRRAIKGIVLYRQGFAPLLVFLGVGSHGRRSEAEVRAELAYQLGVSRESILTDAGAWTTRTEAERVGRLLRPRGVRKILLVTDSEHLARASLVFKRAGFEVLPVPADDEVQILPHKPEDRLQLSRWIVQEFLARLYYRLAGYL